MANIRKQILSKLETELSLIKAVNGYNTTIRNVYNGINFEDEITDRPSIAFAFMNDDLVDEKESDIERTSDLLLFCYVEAGIDNESTGKLSYAIENLFEDLTKFFNTKPNKITSNYKTTLLDICTDLKLTSKNAYTSTIEGSKTTCSVTLKLTYLDIDEDDDNSSTFSNTAS